MPNSVFLLTHRRVLDNDESDAYQAYQCIRNTRTKNHMTSTRGIKSNNIIGIPVYNLHVATMTIKCHLLS